jgi:hypothetical protein
MELANFVFQIIDLQFIEHHNIVISVLSKQTLKANRAKIIFTESFDVFVPMDFTL